MANRTPKWKTLVALGFVVILTNACGRGGVIGASSGPPNGPSTPIQSQTTPEVQATSSPVTISGTVETTANVQKWEYMSLEITDMAVGAFGAGTASGTTPSFITSDKTVSIQKLNELGAQGWELVGMVGIPGQITSDFVFKRPVGTTK